MGAARSPRPLQTLKTNSAGSKLGEENEGASSFAAESATQAILDQLQGLDRSLRRQEESFGSIVDQQRTLEAHIRLLLGEPGAAVLPEPPPEPSVELPGPSGGKGGSLRRRPAEKAAPSPRPVVSIAVPASPRIAPASHEVAVASPSPRPGEKQVATPRLQGVGPGPEKQVAFAEAASSPRSSSPSPRGRSNFRGTHAPGKSIWNERASEHTVNGDNLALRETFTLAAPAFDANSEEEGSELHSVASAAEAAAEEPQRKFWQNTCLMIVHHRAFKVISLILVFVHAIVIGLYVEHVASWEREVHPVLYFLNTILAVVFVLEVMLELGASRWHFFFGREKCWNLFDLLLVCMITAEVPLALAGGVTKLKSIRKTGEMIRTARVLRVFRFLRFSGTLRLIMSNMFSSLRLFLWVIILFFVLLYVLSVCLTQGCNDYLEGAQHDHHPLPLEESKAYDNFGTISRSFFTLFGSVSGGLDWGEVMDPLEAIGFFYSWAFLSYVAISNLALLNMITAIFVNVQMQSCTTEMDIQVESQRRMQQAHKKYLEKIFAKMDQTRAGTISAKSMQRHFASSRMALYLEASGIHANPRNIMRHLHFSDSGMISKDTFVEGCQALIGQCSKMDFVELQKQTKKLLKDSKDLRLILGQHLEEERRICNRLTTHR